MSYEKGELTSKINLAMVIIPADYLRSANEAAEDHEDDKEDRGG